MVDDGDAWRESCQVPGYEILRPIGRGNMGKVLLARQIALSRNVAIKLVEPSQADDSDDRVARFCREAELMAGVAHPNIVTIHDFGVADGHPYFVMEYVEGGDLRCAMIPRKPMPVERIRALVRPIIDALEYLHQRGILHRDLKPENVLLDHGATPKIADFGIATTDATVGSLTRTDAGMGTIGYAAPEQYYRLRVDERVDQFSLAAIVYELLTGQKPLGAFDPPSRLNRALGPSIDPVVMRALSEDREDRFGTIRAFGDALDQALSPPDTEGRKRAGWLLAVCGSALLAVLIGVRVIPRNHPEHPIIPKPHRAPVPPTLPSSRGIAPGADTTTNSLGMKLVLVPAGSCWMGSPDTDLEARPNEKPRHRVMIRYPFYLGAHEVTVGQFRAFVDAEHYVTDAEKEEAETRGLVPDAQKSKRIERKPDWRHPGLPREQREDEPVVHVSWNDARAFCQWLSKREKQRYRLPTEAEWEYACRAGTATRWFSGDSPEALERFAWTPNSPSPRAHPVGTKTPNAFGLYDMHGNVWEWCLDIYGVYRSEPAVDPTGPTYGKTHVLRGGAWDRKKVRRTTSAYRHEAKPTEHALTYGFRICRPLNP